MRLFSSKNRFNDTKDIAPEHSDDYDEEEYNNPDDK